MFEEELIYISCEARLRRGLVVTTRGKRRNGECCADCQLIPEVRIGKVFGRGHTEEATVTVLSKIGIASLTATFATSGCRCEGFTVNEDVAGELRGK